MMCISDLNPQIQFEKLNMSDAIITPAKKNYKRFDGAPVTAHLAATRQTTTKLQRAIS